VLDKLEQQDLINESERSSIIQDGQELLGIMNKVVLPRILLNLELLLQFVLSQARSQLVGKSSELSTDFINEGMHPSSVVSLKVRVDFELRDCFLQLELFRIKGGDLIRDTS